MIKYRESTCIRIHRYSTQYNQGLCSVFCYVVCGTGLRQRDSRTAGQRDYRFDRPVYLV